MRFKKNEKGELTTQQIAILIITITSFVIILFLLFRLNLGETSDKQVCHNSVVLKSKGSLGEKLDCKTNYVCISGGGKCEADSSINIKIDLNKQTAREDIMKAIADEMADCWWMFGEGKLNYIGEDFGGKTSCAICSVINFDDKIIDLISEKSFMITYREFYEYLNSVKKDDAQTYFTYLYKSYDVNKFQEDISYLKIDLDKELILSDESYNVITGVKKGALFGYFEPEVFLYSYYIKSSEMSNLEPSCTNYITEAA
jgi:hypothetical protein